MCTPNQLECYHNISKKDSKCLKSCRGLYVTNLEKHEFSIQSYSLLQDAENEYRKFKEENLVDVPEVYVWQSNHTIVHIFIESPVFDKITMDTSSKFEDKLSTIGGTLGLLTGFSLISGIEILYFIVKICISFWSKKEKKTSQA